MRQRKKGCQCHSIVYYKCVLLLFAFTQALGNGTESEVTLLKVRQEDRGKTWERESRPRQDLRQACHVSTGSAPSLTQLYAATVSAILNCSNVYICTSIVVKSIHL